MKRYSCIVTFSSNLHDIHFCTLRFTTHGEPGECWFYCTEADIANAKTQEEERIFVAPVSSVLQSEVTYTTTVRHPGVTATSTYTLPTMPNLPLAVCGGAAVSTWRRRPGVAVVYC